MLRHAGSYPSAFLFHPHCESLGCPFSSLSLFFIFLSNQGGSISDHFFTRSAAFFLVHQNPVFPSLIPLFFLRCFRQDRQEGPTRKLLRQALQAPKSTKHPSYQHPYSHSLSILKAFVTSHGPPPGCCCGEPLLCLYSFGPGAIKQSSGQWGVRGNNVWGGQHVSRIKPLLFP